MIPLLPNATTPYQWLSSPSILSLVSLYTIVLSTGIFGNVYIASAIYSQRVVRNYLLLNLCASDFLVCSLSVPASIVNVVHTNWTLGIILCKLTYFLQGTPVAASTWSLMMLSLDRYTSIQHPHFLSQLRHNRHLSTAMIIIVWTVSLGISSPFLYSRSLSTTGQCQDVWDNTTWRTWFVLSHVTLVYLVPGLTVAACHHAVGHKLYAASLSAAAAAGDIPLPMPILGTRKEVIIVASVQNDAPSKVYHYRKDLEDSDDDKIGARIKSDLAELKRLQHPKNLPAGPKLKRHPRSQREARARKSLRRPPLSKPMNRPSLHSRRRLANMLVALVIVFATCWLPYVALMVYSIDQNADKSTMQMLLPFCLLLGHMHSAINPVVYWFLNRQSLRMNSCLPWVRVGSKREKTAKLKLFAKNRRASSTNEAALGVFHPRYNVPKRHIPQPKESSQFYA